MRTTAPEGLWDSDRRLRELRADGVVADHWPRRRDHAGWRGGQQPLEVGIATYQTEQAPALWQAGTRRTAGSPNSAPASRASAPGPGWKVHRDFQPIEPNEKRST